MSFLPYRSLSALMIPPPPSVTQRIRLERTVAIKVLLERFAESRAAHTPYASVRVARCATGSKPRGQCTESGPYLATGEPLRKLHPVKG